MHPRTLVRRRNEARPVSYHYTIAFRYYIAHTRQEVTSTRHGVIMVPSWYTAEDCFLAIVVHSKGKPELIEAPNQVIIRENVVTPEGFEAVALEAVVTSWTLTRN